MFRDFLRFVKAIELFSIRRPAYLQWQSELVTRSPLAFIIVPLCAAAAIVAAACANFRLNQSKQSLEMFLPDSMESLARLHELRALFPPKDALRDSYSLFGSKFAYVIFEDTSETRNALAMQRLVQVAALHTAIQGVVTVNFKYANFLGSKNTHFLLKFRTTISPITIFAIEPKLMAFVCSIRCTMRSTIRRRSRSSCRCSPRTRSCARIISPSIMRSFSAAFD